MGFILTLLVIASFISIIVYFDHNRDDHIERQKACSNTLWTFIICTVIAAIVCGFIYGASYANYVNMKKKEATIEQYVHTVKLYSGYGAGGFMLEKMLAGGELTDLKYQNYQTEMAQILRSARNSVREYNETLIGKAQFKDSLYWGTLIYLPAHEDTTPWLLETWFQPEETEEPVMDPEKDKEPAPTTEGGRDV